MATQALTTAVPSVGVYSLDSKEQERVGKALRKGFGKDVKVVLPPPLLRSQLKDIKLRETAGDGDRSVGMILLFCFNEGRVLLTDEDGMYNDFLLEACRITDGNVFMALGPVTTPPSALANESLVTALAYSGGQQGLLSIHMQGRFLTWDKTPSEVQLDRLREALNGEVEPLEVPDSVLAYSEGQQMNGLSFCDIL